MPPSFEQGRQQGRAEATLETVQKSVDALADMFEKFEERCQKQCARVESNRVGIKWVAAGVCSLFGLTGMLIVVAVRAWLMKG